MQELQCDLTICEAAVAVSTDNVTLAAEDTLLNVVGQNQYQLAWWLCEVTANQDEASQSVAPFVCVIWWHLFQSLTCPSLHCPKCAELIDY